jgi:hypothetical protein
LVSLSTTAPLTPGAQTIEPSTILRRCFTSGTSAVRQSADRRDVALRSVGGNPG